MKTHRIKTAIIGCGKISDIYFKNITEQFDIIELVSCASKAMSTARNKAAQYGLKAQTVDEILNDPDIDLIVNLTPAEAHFEIIHLALLAGKHVFTEKALTSELEQAKILIDLADTKSLYLGCAPETFLGGAIQAAKNCINEGLIGEITGCEISVNINVDVMYPIFRNLTKKGSGIGLDRGIYFVTAACALLGPIVEVAGFVRTLNPQRTITPINPPNQVTLITI